jgi:hypothetical protein
MWENYEFVREQYPLSNYTSLILATVSYLVVVKWLQEYMRSRKKYDLKGVVLVHNGFLCLLSLVMAGSALFGVISKALGTFLKFRNQHPIICFKKKRFVLTNI